MLRHPPCACPGAAASGLQTCQYDACECSSGSAGTTGGAGAYSTADAGAAGYGGSSAAGSGGTGTAGQGGTGGSGAAGSGGSSAAGSGGTGSAGQGGTGSTVTVVMAGDIAESGRTSNARDNAHLITTHATPVSAVILAGDNSRWDGLTGSLLSHYQTYYSAAAEANWGQFDAIAFPQVGNHEYGVFDSTLNGYFSYFATRITAIKALPSYSGFVDGAGKAYYSFDLNGWHIVSLNTNCANVTGGCAAGSAQELWLKADLAAHATKPIIATWHHPRYTCGGSGAHTDATEVQDLWADLVDAKADFVFNGHNHFYQRYQPLDKASPAVVDAANGLTEIIAGSYGVSTYPVCASPGARVAKQLGDDPAMGVFFLNLGSDGSWSFEYRLRSDGSVFDSGSGTSHHHL